MLLTLVRVLARQAAREAFELAMVRQEHDDHENGA
jgi:hypothetical protein